MRANAGLASVKALLGPFDDIKTAALPARYADTAVETVAARRRGPAGPGNRAVDGGEIMDGRTVRTGGRGFRDRGVAFCPPVPPEPPVRPGFHAHRRGADLLAALVESYGVSSAEGPVREAVRRLLPAWVKSETDTAGNLWVRVGQGSPVVVFIAHLDEIGSG